MDPTKITSRQIVLSTREYRVVAHTSPSTTTYVIEYAKQDAMGEPSWNLLKKITPSFHIGDVDDFLFQLLEDVYKGVT